MNIEITEANGKGGTLDFIKCQGLFYKDDTYFVAPLIYDRKKLLNKQVNPFYRHADMQLFLARLNGQIVGRIAAITNENHFLIHNDKVGFFGFFESINDKAVACKLFDTAEKWLKDRGCHSIRGPVNPSMNDEVGLLVEGFDSSPVILMNYNPSYYIELIESCGFIKARDLYAYLLEEEVFITEKLLRMQKIVRERFKIKIRNVDFSSKTGFMRDVEIVKSIYNSAWEPNWGFVKMTDAEFDFLANDLKQIAIPDLTIIAESEGQPIGFAFAIPDINQCLKHNKSGALLSGFWHLLTKKKRIDTMRIIVLGILKQYQQKGIDSILYYEVGVRAPMHGITKAEASWVLEDNEMMNRSLASSVNAKLYKKYRIYEKAIL